MNLNQSASVNARVEYVSPNSKVYRRFVCPGREVNTGECREHRWYYYPNMTPDELLIFKLYDSEETGAWRVPHGSFRDTTYADANGRESAEIRTVLYFK